LLGEGGGVTEQDDMIFLGKFKIQPIYP